MSTGAKFFKFVDCEENSNGPTGVPGQEPDAPSCNDLKDLCVKKSDKSRNTKSKQRSRNTIKEHQKQTSPRNPKNITRPRQAEADPGMAYASSHMVYIAKTRTKGAGEVQAVAVQDHGKMDARHLTLRPILNLEVEEIMHHHAHRSTRRAHVSTFYKAIV